MPDDTDDEFEKYLDFAKEAWNFAEEKGLWAKLTAFFRREEAETEKLLILGSTGVGKTNMLQSLATKTGLTTSISREDRTDDFDWKRTLNVGDQRISVIDTPGQDLHEGVRKQEFVKLANSPPVRIINVVSYGYHEYKEPAVEEAVDENNHPRSEFLADHRVGELAALDEFLGYFNDRKITPWILTVVSKADLWWEQKRDVLKYYESGAYAAQIRAKDPKIRHVVAPYCAVIHRFYGTAVLPGTFDDDTRIATNHMFLSRFASLVDKSNGF